MGLIASFSGFGGLFPLPAGRENIDLGRPARIHEALDLPHPLTKEGLVFLAGLLVRIPILGLDVEAAAVATAESSREL